MADGSNISMLGNAITTRVLERRISREKSSGSITGITRKSSTSSETTISQNSGTDKEKKYIDYKFLTGTMVPNSVIRKSFSKTEKLPAENNSRKLDIDKFTEMFRSHKEKKEDIKDIEVKDVPPAPTDVFIKEENDYGSNAEPTPAHSEGLSDLWERIKERRRLASLATAAMSLVKRLPTIKEQVSRTSAELSEKKDIGNDLEKMEELSDVNIIKNSSVQSTGTIKKSKTNSSRSLVKSRKKNSSSHSKKSSGPKKKPKRYKRAPKYY